LSATKVLIVDDEPQTRRVLRIGLIAQGFEVIDARSGEEALESLRSEPPDVILLDLRMPGMGGLQTCREIRCRSEVPVLVVSAGQTEREKVNALESGADDYLVKPFGMEELVARIHAVRRRAAPQTRLLHLGEVAIDLDSREVRRDGRVLHLTAKEFKLLSHLVSHAGEVLSHRGLLQAVWGPDYGNEVEYLRVFINQLRKKIEPDPRHPRYILTEPSAGYRFAPPSVKASGGS
jgi:two-component system, OmpR family, KDP operon response regulator KdpE